MKILEPLKLAEYQLIIAPYPMLGRHQPFKDWAPSKPTLTLPWYDAYNKVKHDRDSNFSSATIINAVNAVAAFVIMLAAQYRIIPYWRDRIGHFFEIAVAPYWTPGTGYIYDADKKGEWVRVKYQF